MRTGCSFSRSSEPIVNGPAGISTMSDDGSPVVELSLLSSPSDASPVSDEDEEPEPGSIVLLPLVVLVSPVLDTPPVVSPPVVSMGSSPLDEDVSVVVVSPVEVVELVELALEVS